MTRIRVILFISFFLFLSCERNDLYKKTQEMNISKSYIALTSTGTVWKTDDITNGEWTSETSLPTNTSDIAYGNEKVVAVGGNYPPSLSGFSYISNDIDNWTSTITASTTTVLHNIIYANNLFITIGDDGGTTRHVRTSSDGITWNTAISPPSGIYNVSYNLKEIAYGNGHYVIAGGFSSNGETAVSTDTVIWNVTSPNCSYLNGAAYGNGIFIVVGRTGTIYYSNDNGSSWTDASPGGNDLSSASYGNGLFVVAGVSGQIWTSPDGITWTDKTTIASDLARVVFSENRFIAVGNTGTVIWSTDGITWKNANTGGADNLVGITTSSGL